MVINFRELGWGCNHYFEPQDDGTYYGPCWYPYSISVGDTVHWKTNYGHAVAEVTAVKPAGDPSDMYWVTSKITARVADPRIVSQAEIDEAFYG